MEERIGLHPTYLGLWGEVAPACHAIMRRAANLMSRQLREIEREFLEARESGRYNPVANDVGAAPLQCIRSTSVRQTVL